MSGIKNKIASDPAEQQRIKRLIHFRTKYISPSQNKAAKLLDTPQSTLSYVENGERQISLSLLEKIYTKYNMNSEWFRNGTGPEVLKDPKKRNTIDTITELRAEISVLEKKIKVFEINQIKTFNLLDALEKRLDKAGI
ncbi:MULTISPECIES: helix-turn-helix domain-containing protein [unclassified Pedobacter]|uniref:helix-turn-helix domain-containing protein n=1 Tax=unclassified Pedobacter TaxID=2628915 RepID=UPI001420818C|nr:MULTISPECIES: helix-turn-helix transcriptional regulator [unclassified Pedobacter]NII81681.1 transcriptional regulator with XRE-family HTH domain [Pedobacter sp. SG908]NMN35685.1 transcriptional regulator with XRE-family HTH domain [Pedobacter sp. SG918]